MGSRQRGNGGEKETERKRAHRKSKVASEKREEVLRELRHCWKTHDGETER